MNYWHLQLFPGERDKEFPISKIQEILKLDKPVIGLGVWDEGEDYIKDFKNRMAVGDIVAIRKGAKPIALVKVTSDAFWEDHPNLDLDWFEHRRKIKVLDFYAEAYNFSIKQTRGTLCICADKQTDTAKVIIAWHQTIQKRRLMENISLSEERKNEIRTLWKNFKAQFTDNDLKQFSKKIEQTLNEWNQYADKLKNGKLILEDYTNRKGEVSATLPGYYLCNFLERGSKEMYGSSRPGNANNFEVKLNDDGKTYTIGAELAKDEKKNENEYERANQVYETEIKPLLESIVNAPNPLEKVSLIENSAYAAKQVLSKMAALENRGDFLFMYSEELISPIHEEFLDSNEERTLGKNYEVRAAINHILGLNKSDDLESYLVYQFLLKYVRIKGVADEDSPNVILYGPPGTGKTYEVKQSLDFLCQGDRSRYEFVQFHPSFTYEDFIEGIKPKGVSKDGNIRFEIVNGIFKEFCIRAKNNPDKNYYFVVDEINRANLSAVFGEALLCLEKDYRHDLENGSNDQLIKTQYSKLIEDLIKEDSSKAELAYHTDEDSANVYFGIPKNLFFIGMMNDVDKSIDSFDLALRRRFKWERKDCDYNVIEDYTLYRNGSDFENIEAYVSSCKRLNDYISIDLGMGRSYEFGHSFFMKMTSIAKRKVITKKNLEELFNLHLRPTLKEYLRAMYPESELDKNLDKALDLFKILD